MGLFTPQWRHKDPQVRMTWINKVKPNKPRNQKKLVQIAISDPEESVSLLALEKIMDKELLGEISYSSDYINVRKAAVRKITDEEELIALIELNAFIDNECLSIAIGFLNDQNKLIQLARNSGYQEVRLAATKKITDIDVLNTITALDENDEVVEAANQKIESLRPQPKVLEPEELPPNTFQDSRDGKIYKTVKIGNQVWMAENLAYETKTGSWLYQNIARFKELYGLAYNWKTALEACPEGWHLPSEEEWKELKGFVAAKGYEGKEGKGLRSKAGWKDEVKGTDEFKFDARPGGVVSFLFEENHNSEGVLTRFWTSSEYEHGAYCMTIFGDQLTCGGEGKDDGYYVRCVKDN